MVFKCNNYNLLSILAKKPLNKTLFCTYKYTLIWEYIIKILCIQQHTQKKC